MTWARPTSDFRHALCLRHCASCPNRVKDKLHNHIHKPAPRKVGVMYGNPETTTGGRALKFYASVRLDIRRSEVPRPARRATETASRSRL